MVAAGPAKASWRDALRLVDRGAAKVGQMGATDHVRLRFMVCLRFWNPKGGQTSRLTC